MDIKNVKLVAATAGAGALLAMGAVTVAVNTTSAAEPAPPGPVVTSEVSTGETTTEEAPATTPTTTLAEPPIVGPAPLPEEEAELPG